MKKITTIFFLTFLAQATPYRAVGINFPLNAPDASLVSFTSVLPAVTFTVPTFMAFAPDNSGRVFVLEQSGLLKVATAFSTTATARVFANFRAIVSYDGGEEGLLGMAFSPDFASTREIFVAYTAPNTVATATAAALPKRVIVARLNVSATNPLEADMATLQSVMEISKGPGQFPNHNGGMIAFGPDRMLYIGVGDGGSEGDPYGNGQNKNVLLGKILRIDPLSAKPYKVPADNPFVGQANTQPEIWAYGLRNPWRFSFDMLNNPAYPQGRIFVGDVGQNLWEEVDVVKSGGANFGWNVYEGLHSYDNPNNLPLSDFVSPIWAYPHNPETSIIGGYVYRGSKMPQLNGSYIYGDYGSGKVWAMQLNGDTESANYQIGSVNAPSSFAQDASGEVYVVSHGDGKVYRLDAASQSNSSAAAIPALLSQTGIFSNTAQMLPTDGLEEYTVAAPLWSDGADKTRWMGLPATGNIIFSTTGAWTYPVGTVFVKHFALATTTGEQRLETRVMFNHTQGWRGYTYVWNAAGTDANLITNAQTQSYQVPDSTAPNGVRTQTWYFPSRDDCMGCHNFSVGGVLGGNTGQLNHNFPTDNQLLTMNNNQLFTTNIFANNATPSQYQQYSDPSDTTLLLEPRARSYLAANCVHCHNPNGVAPGQLDFSFAATDADMNVINVPVTESTPDSGYGTVRVDPGNPLNSALYNRMCTLDTVYRMPPLATSVVDQVGTDLISDWIKSLQ